MNLADAIRTIPDYPKPGILFRDITTLLADARGLPPGGGRARRAVRRPARSTRWPASRRAASSWAARSPHRLGAGFVPLRKKGKLPHETRAVEYALEYGTDVLEMHLDAVLEGERVLLIDDLIATGGTALAAVDLLSRRGADDRRRRASSSTCPISAERPACEPPASMSPRW